MAFTRRRRRDPLAWDSFKSAQEFALALMLAGVSTEEARRRLRHGIAENQRLADAQRADAEQRRTEAERAERAMEGAFLAAEKLLREVGWESGGW